MATSVAIELTLDDLAIELLLEGIAIDADRIDLHLDGVAIE